MQFKLIIFFHFIWTLLKRWTSIGSSINCSKTEARMQSFLSRKSEAFASKLEKSSWSNPCSSNSKLPSKSVVLHHSPRRHPRTILRLDKAVRIRRFSRRHQLSLFGGLRRQGKTVHRNHLPDASLQDQKSWEFLYAQRKPRMLQHQPYLRFLWLMYIFNLT